MTARRTGRRRSAEIADPEGSVCVEPVHGVAIPVRVDRGGPYIQLISGTEGTDSDLATIGDERFGKHWFIMARQRLAALLQEEHDLPGLFDKQRFSRVTFRRHTDP